MLNSLIKLVVSKLNGLLLLVTLTGFVCTNKAHPGEECLCKCADWHKHQHRMQKLSHLPHLSSDEPAANSNVLCFECDSRYDPNCADPFDFSPTATLDTSSMIAMMSIMKHKAANETIAAPSDQQDPNGGRPGGANATNKRQPKQLPKAVVCHGCCVKITSRMPDGGVYVKRTCTSNLQINYFMVGLVCMKESGDRGKMCFCETDYCNGQPSIHAHGPASILLALLGVVLVSVALIVLKPIQEPTPI